MRESVYQKQTRQHYHRDQFRKMTTALQWSLFLNCLLFALMLLFYLSWPVRTYFASNAAYAGSVIQLTPLSEPNSSSTPLLLDDLPSETFVKPLTLPGDSPDPDQPATATTSYLTEYNVTGAAG